MAFTPLGYLRIGPIAATLLMIPVAIGAIRLGPVAGGLLGGVFGLTSFAQCFGMDFFGTTLLGINAFSTFVVCMVPRVVMGIGVGYLYRLFYKDDGEEQEAKPSIKKVFAMGIASFASAAINTCLFLGFFIVLFGTSDFVKGMQGATPLFVFIFSLAGINAIVELLVATFGGTLICQALDRAGLLRQNTHAQAL
jgi:uncharacterized membrane protein